MSLEFLITTVVIVVPPGTGALYVLSAGLGRGNRASLIATTGSTLGVVPHLIAAMTGLAAILHTSRSHLSNTEVPRRCLSPQYGLGNLAREGSTHLWTGGRASF